MFGRGVILHVLGRESGYFGWKGIPEVLPNFLPLVDELLNYYHHLLHRLVGSIYQTHQLLVLGLLRQWLVSWYSDSLETEVLSPRELLSGELHVALSTSILPWVMLLHPCFLHVGHDLTLEILLCSITPVVIPLCNALV